MGNKGKDLKELEEARSFVRFCFFASKNKGHDIGEWTSEDWSEWRKTKLKELMGEEERYWKKDNWKDLLRWELIELGHVDFEGNPIREEWKRELHIVKQLEGIEHRGYTIHPESLRPNRYRDGYIILASITEEDERRAQEKMMDLRDHLDKKRIEFEKEIEKAEELVKKIKKK